MKTNKPSIWDYIIHAKYFILIWLSISSLLFRRGPINLIQDLIKYKWLFQLLKASSLMGRFAKGRSGYYRKSIEMLLLLVVRGVVDMIVDALNHKENLVLNQEMVSPEIAQAMGLNVWTAEIFAILLPLLNPHGLEGYIDRCENEGVPADICSHVKSTLGIALLGEMPHAPVIVSSNLPCDGNMTGYEIIRKKLNSPILRIDIPFNFYDEKATSYFTGELYRMIKWLEEKTPGHMDWEKLRAICENRNRMAELEIELWEMVSLRPAPLASEAVWLSHLWAFNIVPGNPKMLQYFEKLISMARKNLETGVQAVPNESFRTMIWNPPFLHFADLFRWAEETYGVSIIIDSMTYNSQSPIDTSTNDSMLRGIGNIMMQGPMARHTRGPAANYLEDIFSMVRRFNLDMVWVAGHIGCKNTIALNQMLRELCRERGIPLLIVEYDLSDPRIVSHDGIKQQIEHFMTNVMKAKRFDTKTA